MVRMADEQDFTVLLSNWRGGSKEAGDELMAAAYERLHALASRQLRQERGDHTLQATALVHELYVKLFSSAPVALNDRAHFFAVAARQLRRILVDHARAVRSEKRGGDRVRVSLTEIQQLPSPIDVDILDLDDALKRLEALDARAAAGVELRFFAGLTESELVAALGVSPVTLYRDWRFARAWLLTELAPPLKPEH